MNVSNLANDVKVAATVAMGAMGTGISMFLALIPTDIGKLASLAAFVLTVVLTRNHLRNGKKLNLENEKLRFEIAELADRDAKRREQAAARIAAGLPVRHDERD